jgi:DNA end-binding protein Ku
LPSRARSNGSSHSARRRAADSVDVPVRSFWSGTIAFGLVSIPVDLLAATRPRQTSMKLVDADGHALGRRFRCAKDGKELDQDDLVRGFETSSGELVPISDEEIEAASPEASRDIELHRFVPFEQIPRAFYVRSYFLAPAGRSAKAYVLLAKTMERTQRVAIGSFVMRGEAHLVAVLSDNGVLRATTLRYADELRSPKDIGLTKPKKKAAAAQVRRFTQAIEGLMRKTLDIAELEDRQAESLRSLAERKREHGKDVIALRGLVDAEEPEGSAEIIDLTDALRKSLSRKTRVATQDASAPREQAASVRKIGHARAKRSAATRDLARTSKSELLKLAAELDIAGRSKMDKQALVSAIRKAG